ncbi:MAG: hypothetical protein ACRDI2_13750 [Chloroflexota bacterium]
MLQEVNLTTARNLSPLFDEAVRRERPVMIVRGRRERGLLLSRDALLRLLQPYTFHVDVLPEDDGSFTLWLHELDLAGNGPGLKDARAALLQAIRSYLQYYADEIDLFRHLPDKARQEPYVLRLSLAKDDSELIAMLFGPQQRGEAEAPEAAPGAQ